MILEMWYFPGVTTGQLIIFSTILLLAIIGIAVTMSAYLFKERVLSNKQLLESYFQKYTLNVRQREILEALTYKNPNLDIKRFFQDKNFFDYIVKNYLKSVKWDGESKDTISRIERELKDVKEKLNFSTRRIFSSKDIPEGDSVKAKIGEIGLFSLKVMSNDSEGLLLKFPYIEKLKEEGKIKKLTLYYWSDQRDYKIDTRLKEVVKEEEDFILVAHGKAEVHSIDPSGGNIHTEAVPVYFEHIFDLTPKEMREIKTHIFRGNIVTFSRIGLEVVTREKIVYKDTDFKFEFRDGHNRYRFTGTLSNIHKAADGTHFFVTYKTIGDRTRSYIDSISKREIS